MFMLLYELQFGHLASVCGMDDFYGVSCFWSVAVVVLLIFIALIESPTWVVAGYEPFIWINVY
jgi:hypothetical protein